MSTSPAVGIIGGAGWLGMAIASQALGAGVITEQRLTISSRSPRAEKLGQWHAVNWTSDNDALVRQSDVVILSVRPHQFFDLSIQADGKLVISVMAGVSLETLQTRLGTSRVVRAMPNAAAEIGRSYTPWLAGEGVMAGDRAFVRSLFESCGEADEVGSEEHIDYLTGLSGSGPAFPALLAAAMLAHAKSRGLPPEIARRAVLGVVCDASRLLALDDETPEQVVQTFIDYEGTTAAALRAMMSNGLPEGVNAGLDAAAKAATTFVKQIIKVDRPG